MRIVIIILFFSFSISCNTLHRDINVNMPGLEVVKRTNRSQLAGIYKIEFAYDRLVLKLKPSGIFTEDYYSCTEHESRSGKWELNDQNILLTDSNGCTSYDVHRFHQFYLLIPSGQKDEFIRPCKTTISPQQASEFFNEGNFPRYINEFLEMLVYCKTGEIEATDNGKISF